MKLHETRNESAEDVPNNAQCTNKFNDCFVVNSACTQINWRYKIVKQLPTIRAHEFRIACETPSINRFIVVFLVFVSSINIRNISPFRSLLSFDSCIFVAQVSYKILILDAHIPCIFFFSYSLTDSREILGNGIEFLIPKNRIP